GSCSVEAVTCGSRGVAAVLRSHRPEVCNTRIGEIRNSTLRLPGRFPRTGLASRKANVHDDRIHPTSEALPDPVGIVVSSMIGVVNEDFAAIGDGRTRYIALVVI